MIEKVRLKAQIIWYFPSIVNVVKITRPLRSYRTPNHNFDHKNIYISQDILNQPHFYSS